MRLSLRDASRYPCCECSNQRAEPALLVRRGSLVQPVCDLVVGLAGATRLAVVRDRREDVVEMMVVADVVEVGVRVEHDHGHRGEFVDERRHVADAKAGVEEHFEMYRHLGDRLCNNIATLCFPLDKRMKPRGGMVENFHAS